MNPPSTDLYWARLLGCVEGRDAPLLQRAYHLAWRAHRGQVRDGGQIPYLTHPLRVALLLARELERTDPALLSIALLHDVLEDSEVQEAEIAHACGAEVVAAVRLLTKPPVGEGGKAGRDATYFAAIAQAPLVVRLVKCADRVDNLRSLRELNQPARLARTIAQSRRYLLPIAATTVPALHQTLFELCGRDAGDGTVLIHP